jgi:hypothetical protein
VIPSSFSLEGFNATPETVVGPAKCPLCRTVISDESRERADTIHVVLCEAQLTSSERDALLSVMTRLYKGKASYPEVVEAVEASAPKAAGLKRFIPPGDVTGALALIIAVLTFANEFVFDWVAPTLKRSSGETTGSSSASPQQSRWVKLSSFTVSAKEAKQPEADKKYKPEACYYTLKGSWAGRAGDRLYHTYILWWRKPSWEIVSERPGPWQYPMYVSRHVAEALNDGLMNAFFIRQDDIYEGPLTMEVALAAAILPFTASIPSGPPHVMSIKIIAIEEFVDWYNSKRHLVMNQPRLRQLWG